MLERIEEILNSGLISQSDKKFIRETSDALGVAFNPKNGCKDCYNDQLHMLRKRIKDMQNEFPGEETKEIKTISVNKCRYKLRPELKIDVIHQNVRINADNLTDEKAEMLIKAGLSRWFENDGIPSDEISK